MRLVALAASLVLLAGCSGNVADEHRPAALDVDEEEESPSREATSASAASRAIPQGAFTGASGGCANVQAYRSSLDGTQFAVVEVERATLGLEPGGTKMVDLGEEPEGVAVFVDVYATAPSHEAPYCTDDATSKPAVTRWVAQAGKLTIALTPADPANGSYRATVQLEKVHFVGPEGGFAVVVPSVVIEDVRVGWRPG
jgi:hypothetical protein